MALKRLALRDFVIVRELELDLASGFTVLTGETGAGKSILIDAVQLVLGARADNGLVREGASRLEVTAEFEVTVAQHQAQHQNLHVWLSQWLAEAGFDNLETLLLRRTVDVQGKSRAWVNGSPATATQLKELGDALVDIHGQHAWATLSRPDAVRDLLDAYAGCDTTSVRAAWTAWRQCVKALEAAQASQGQQLNERERLLWQIGEVAKLAPGADEWDELNAQHTKQTNAQALIEAAHTALTALQNDAHEGSRTAERLASGDVISSLSKAMDALQSKAAIEPEFAALSDLLASSLAQLEDAAHSLNSYLRHTEPDPARLAELDERMALWLSLSRRYKRKPDELHALYTSWQTELAQLDAASDLGALQAAEQAAAKTYQTAAALVSKKRQAAAPKLASSITQAMQGLGMSGGVFEVALTPTNVPTQAGLEEVAFLVAGHAGSTPRPVGKVASGGELSRIALAISVVTSQLGSAQTLIFDEVDSGVGGAVAQTVGKLMRQLGQDRQVLAVTHLPQVAACANQHWVVAKHSHAGNVHSSVTPVQGDARVAEVARMLGGATLTDVTRAHALEMLNVA
ncbi:MAG TPA: DNA repair protein RecN [Burkholderiaceae bacterium]|nr:DNA repair protein RecN [Burkholderiaceae bacterium]